jgi:hypothetical protein
MLDSPKVPLCILSHSLVRTLLDLPTDAGGVEIKFLRKKTDEKSGTDGGLCFFIETGIDDAGTALDSATADDMDNDDKSSRMISVTVKRNSAGQTIRKIIAERLVVTSYVASLTATGNSQDDAPATITPGRTAGAIITGSRPSPVAEQVVRVTSLFHKWM